MEVVVRPSSEDKYTFFIEKLRDLISSDGEAKNYAPDYLVIGGDGTLNYFLNSIFDKDEADVLYIPGGTANDFSKSLGIERPDKLLDTSISGIRSLLLSSRFVSCPVMKCNETYFVNVVTIGAPAEVTESGTGLLKKVLGQWSYYLSALEKLTESKSLRTKAVSTHLNEDLYGAGHIVGQGLFAGGGVRVTDKVNPMFGEFFYATLASGEKISEALKSVIKMQTGELEEVDTARSYLLKNELHLSFDREVTLKVDGELEKASEIKFSKTNKKVKFLVF